MSLWEPWKTVVTEDPLDLFYHCPIKKQKNKQTNKQKNMHGHDTRSCNISQKYNFP